MSRHVHIVCLDSPSPPDYGGAIDMFYKIKSLSALGINITLHHFQYKKDRNIQELKPYCSKIIAYKRKTGISGISFTKPYIIHSRINRELIKNLNNDNHPILLEGFHCTGIIPFLDILNRRIVIRVHNDEAIYYQNLVKSEVNWIKKAYFFIESILLKKYQKKLPDSCTYAFISETDKQLYQKQYRIKNCFFIPSFIPWQKLGSPEGKGSYVLYHGNLSIAENEQAASWLINKVITRLDYPFIIAGKNASNKLQKLADRYKNIIIVNNPSEPEMKALIHNAHLHIVPSFNQTGVKLKLLNVLLNGRFCVTNNKGVQGSQLEELVRMAETPQHCITLIQDLMQQTFQKQDIAIRQKLLQLYNNDENAHQLSDLLYNTSIV